MIDLGAIPVRSQGDVGLARRKVFDVAASLTRDSVRATRLGTAASEICRHLLRARSAGAVALFLEARGPTLDLRVQVSGSTTFPPSARGFFDDVRRGDGVWVALASLGPVAWPSDRDLEGLRLTVQRKSRDTLMADLTDKNAELQQSLDDLRQTRSAKERMESELSIGREIQMAMLPLVFPDRAEFEIHAVLRPARQVGGDFYDFFLLGEHTLAVCIGDVSGKGVPAALFMAVTRTLVKSRAALDASPAAILTHVNDELAEGNDSAMFVTLFVATVDLRTGAVRYSNAGHNPPFVVRAGGDLELVNQRHGPVVGAVEDIAYREGELSLSPGDLLLLYTDGVTEAMNTRGELYGEARLHHALGDAPARTPAEFTEQIADAVRHFEGEADQADDVTLLAVRYQGSVR